MPTNNDIVAHSQNYMDSNDLFSNGDSPVSTLAAQIADNLTQGSNNSKIEDREKLRKLLQEILQTDDESEEVTENVEKRIDINRRLIYVIIRVGLESLFNDDPFNNQSSSKRQVDESLSVVELTLRKSPEVLFSVFQSHEADIPLRGPLYLWLIPRLFMVPVKFKDADTRIRTLQVLEIALGAERKPSHFQGRSKVISRYIQGCIKDLLFYAEESRSLGGENHAHQQSFIPTMATISEVYSIEPHESGPQSLVQVKMQTVAEANLIVVCLLSVVGSLDSKDLKRASRTDFISSQFDWTLSCFAQVWDSLGPIEGPLVGYFFEQCLLAILESLSGILSLITIIAKGILDFTKAAALLNQIVACVLSAEPVKLAADLEKTLSCCLLNLVILCESFRAVSNIFDETLLPILIAIADNDDRMNGFGFDLQHSVKLSILIRAQKHGDPYPYKSVLQKLKSQNIDLHRTYERVMSSINENDPQAKKRPKKRVRLSVSQDNKESVDVRLELVKELYHGLGIRDISHYPGLDEISGIATDQFPKLSDEEQVSAFLNIGQITCAGAQTLSSSRVKSNRTSLQYTCSICDATMGLSRAEQYCDDSSSDVVFALLTSLLKITQKQKPRRLRVAATIAYRSLLIHSKRPNHLELTNSPLGPWCMQALQSSVRDLRIVAGRTLPVFLQTGIDERILTKNRICVLDSLRNLSEKGELGIQETCILAWGQIACVSSNDEMNIVLLRLVEYLGHTNPLICGVAYDEIQKISKHSPYLAMQLFMPFWRTIAPTVVKDLQRRPQIAQYLSDLLAMSVPEFLCLTQVHTVPYLVLTKKRDILQRIADASGRTPKSLCMDHNNIAAILACVLLNSSDDMENTIRNLLNTVSLEFSSIDYTEFVKAEPILTASELLKTASDENSTEKPKAYRALQFLATIVHGKTRSARSAARKANTIGVFFEAHVLGIMAHLADTINDGRGPQPTSEKLRCLGAIREMIILAENYIINGLPQICACLRAAIENRDLCNLAFAIWIVMIGTLGEDEITTLIDPTFAIIAQHWESFHHELQVKAHEAVSQLMISHSATVRDAVVTIPSLSSIPLMSKFEEEMRKFKDQMDIKRQYEAFIERCQSENAVVVIRALTDLEVFLTKNGQFLHEAAMHEQPDPVVGRLIRSVIDACVLFRETYEDISTLSAKCIGLIGCLDPTRIEAAKDKKEMLVLSNFGEAEETKDFVIFFFCEVLVKAFLSATNPRSQGFLAYAMQELLSFIEFEPTVMIRSRDEQLDANYLRWMVLPESVKNTLTPFLTSKYVVTPGMVQKPYSYPLYTQNMSHRQWLRTFVFDLLRKGVGENVQQVFPVLSRITRTQDVSISSFLLPFAALNVVISGTEIQKNETANELLTILNHQLPDSGLPARESLILCSHNVFQVFDYLSRWMQEKKKQIADSKNEALRTGRGSSQIDQEASLLQIQKIDSVLNIIPAEVISRRAVECRSYARALFHWEQYIRQQKYKYRKTEWKNGLENLYERLQDIYTQIDEPDGIEGISAHLQVLNIDQQILEHRKAGRWTAVQGWYELLLSEQPDNLDVQLNLLTSLKESCQHDVLLNQIDGFQKSQASATISLPFAMEASWVTGKWAKLKQYISLSNNVNREDFNVGIGRALDSLSQKDFQGFSTTLERLRQTTARNLSASNTASLRACHDAMLKFHSITEVEAISGVLNSNEDDELSLLSSLNRRLELLGAFVTDKQYVLGLRRATMQLSKRDFSKIDIASTWLATAKLARKGGYTHSAFNAVLRASQLGDVSATIEHSRLLWSEGHHRKAIRSLEGAISANAFRSRDYTQVAKPLTAAIQSSHSGKYQQQNLVKAKAYLLLAKWTDRAGQTQSDIIISRYKNAIDSCKRWEKGHYYLGKHYNKLLESEKEKPPGKQAQTFITGETGKLVVENYLRAICFGAKYIYQTLPRILTLWLELGSDAEQPLDPKYGNDEKFRHHTTEQRQRLLAHVNTQVKKNIERLPPFVWYTAFSQLVARICHKNETISGLLIEIITKVVISHPAQAIWTLLALLKSSSKDRAERGQGCHNNILNTVRKNKTGSSEILTLIVQAQKLSAQLLHVCEGEIQGKPTHISITKILGFNHKVAPCKIVVPIESMLTASLPTITENVNIKLHKAFPKDTVTVSAFLDEALVLSSLQRPRKISVRGSDGHLYALLCKPKDDLRKDQRLMEFNAMINRALKKDAESSKRQLYIKTYAVTPLNEECGLIEWVDKLKTLRDILLHGYKQKHVPISYPDLRQLLAEAISDTHKLHIFHDKVIAHFPPLFHEWFVEMFPEPGVWFAARLRYTRSCAVMSIVGHVLGLGDRHGENILFEEGNGGTFHVDFNCLFDKGLTFEKPELVPFRLTHNMVDAFGAYGYEGPFRKSCELTLNILRQHEDTLMTILETFLYDPTTDFIGPKKKKYAHIVPDTPTGVLESVRNKVRGLLPAESVPLSVEGYVQELIRQATDPFRLASMYIGWCAFF